ncbi:hypothetical protein GOAMR_03_00490 [Gordonia amarae NBRC 15530]|uniref:Uncharacterized protein n=1 Tax=Gordonia amarae NBRC 15530 TaxID=1075090 RepID=G7GIW4_9ACTN|nr:hypothetical protein GOAMR_03_00490 [Gordonia amarae NBRC 15530]
MPRHLAQSSDRRCRHESHPSLDGAATSTRPECRYDIGVEGHTASDPSHVGGANFQAESLRLEVDIGTYVTGKQIYKRHRLTFQFTGQDLTHLGLNRPMVQI